MFPSFGKHYRGEPYAIFQKIQKKILEALFICLCIFNVRSHVDLIQPTIMAKIVDVGVAGNRLDYVAADGRTHAAHYSSRSSGSFRSEYPLKSSLPTFWSGLRSDLFSKIQTLSFENLDKFDKASLVTRLTNDVTQVQNFVNGLMRIFMKAPLLCIGSLIMAIRLNPHLAVVLAVSFRLYVCSSY